MYDTITAACLKVNCTQKYGGTRNYYDISTGLCAARMKCAVDVRVTSDPPSLAWLVAHRGLMGCCRCIC